MHTTNNPGRAGFSMVEVALAILVLSVGLLAVFGLFGDALETNKSTIADTQSALFADEVLNGFKASALTMTNATNWASNLQGITVSNPAVWQASAIPIKADGSVRTNQYNYTPVSGSMGQLTDYAYRYQLSLTNSPAGANVQGVMLQVWPIGVASNAPLVFYTEVYNFGM